MPLRIKSWRKIPKGSRRVCRELFFQKKRKHVYIVRCTKRATWIYGNLSYGCRCDEHKEWIEKVAAAGAEWVKKAVAGMKRR